MASIRTRRKWHSLFNGQLMTARRRGYHVRQVPAKIMKDYIGMNPEAAKSIGFPIPENTIYIDKNLSEEAKYHTLKHENIETDLMKNKGWPYWRAHKRALELEK
jgi:hypothetical protein